VVFSEVSTRYIQSNRYISLILDVIRRLFKISYIKSPYYKNLDFSKFDVVITEGLHCKFLKYFKNYRGMLILNDSITVEKRIKILDVDKINRIFKNVLVVTVNDKISFLYKKYGINLDTATIGHAIELDNIYFKERKVFTGKILSIGRLVKEKGYIYIFEAIKNLIMNYPSITLDIYGNGPLKKDLNQYIEENNLKNHIKIYEPLKHENLLKKFSNYELFISHSLEMDYIAEAFHMGNMEAMASGIPVITTDCGGIPYVVGDCAIVCRQKDIKSIEKNIIKLFKSEEEYNKLSLKGNFHIKNYYSLEVIEKKWINIFKGVTTSEM
jgi:glycosyltransferase involved in cell wall biosynthesis